jgi:hypothetical protein
MQGLQCKPELVVTLEGLTGLTALAVRVDGSKGGSLGALCHLTGLQELRVFAQAPVGLLLQLTQLKQLTSLDYEGPFEENLACSMRTFHFNSKVS